MKKVLLLAAILLTASNRLNAQITTVGSTQASNSDGAKQWSIAVTPVAGDALLVGCDFNVGIPFVGISDTAGNTFIQIAPEADSTEFGARAFLATNVKGGPTTITCTLASPTPGNEIYVTELRGVHPTAPLDKAVAVAGSSNTATTSLTITNPNEFVWAYSISGRVTNATGWTSLSSFHGNLVTSRTLAAAGSVTASFRVTQTWTLIVAALNPGSGTITPPPISVTVSPAAANVQINQTTPFTATLQNDTLSKGVTWSLSGAGCSGVTCGSLTNITATAVTYTAPATVPVPATVTLLATSVADPSKSNSSTITIVAVPPISVTVSPVTAKVQVNQTAPFTATLQNDSLNKGVTWSLSGAGCSGATCGSLTNITATTVTYTAPANVPAPATVTLLATSVADTSKSNSSTITVVAVPPISVSVSPVTANVQVNQSAPFTATLQNDTLNKGVTWSLSGAGCSGATCGSLTNITATTVTYTAPLSVPSPSSVTLTATSVADTTKTGTSTITVSSVATQSTITTVGTTQASKNDDSKTWSVAVTPVAGNTLLVGCDFNPGVQFVSVTDTAADTFTLVAPEADSTFFAARAYIATGVKGGPTTVTCTAATPPRNTEIYVTELAGVNASTPIDKVLSVGGLSTPAAGSLTTANTNEFVWAFAVSGQAGNASGWTLLSNFDGNLVTSRTQATPGTVQASFPATQDWTLIAVALIPNGTGVPLPDTQAPTGPSNLAASPFSGTIINLSWTASTDNIGVTGYKVERCQGAGCSNFILVASPVSTTFSDSGLTVSTSYSYRVRAADAAGNLSPYSNTATALTQSTAPVSVSISPRRGGITTSQTLPFTATVTNDVASAGVTWTTTGGTLTGATATSATFSSASAGSFTITATSNADNTQSASTIIGVTDLIGVATYHNNLSRDGTNPQEYALTTSNVNSTSFGKLFSCSIDAEAYAQPLWVPNLAIGGGTHNVIFVATQNDSVYAFDADAKPCVQYWKKSFLGGSVTAVPAGDSGSDDIINLVGITGTPVIDPASNTLYVVAKTKEGTTNYHQRLHAISLNDGSEKFNGPFDITSAITVPGMGDTGDTSAGCTSTSGHVPFCPLRENQRPGLALAGGNVYVAWASHGDFQPYHGWIMSFNASNLAQTPVLYNDSPNGREAGIWMSGGAPAFDSSNNLYVITGNGDYDGVTDFGDSMLKLNSSLVLQDWFTPSVQGSLDSADNDLGSGGAVVLVDLPSSSIPHILIGGGKGTNNLGQLYVINRDNMGKNASTDKSVQQFNLGGMIFSTAAFWQNTLYIGGVGQNLKAFSLNPSTSMLNTPAASASAHTFVFPGTTPAVSSASTTAGTGIVWALDTSSTSAANGLGVDAPAVLYAYDALNLTKQLYRSDTTAGAANAAGNAVKFSVPTVANGKVYVGTQSELTVFGLLP
jgi:hypothetical protein